MASKAFMPGSAKLKPGKPESLPELLSRRQTTLELLKRAHHGTTHWLNIVLLNPEAIHAEEKEESAKLAHQWFVLGTSLSKVLDFEKGVNTIRAIGQVLEEQEYYFASRSAQGMKLLRAKPLEEVQPKADFKPTLTKFDKRIFYQMLDTTHLPIDLGYCEVVRALCDVLTLVYAKFDDGTCTSQDAQEAIFKIDERLRENFFKPIFDNLKNVSYDHLDREIESLKQRFQLDDAVNAKDAKRQDGGDS